VEGLRSACHVGVGTATMAAAMLTPQHTVRRPHSKEYLGGEYGTACMEWEEDRLPHGISVHDQLYLRVYLGTAAEEGAGGEGEGEGEAGIDTDTPRHAPGSGSGGSGSESPGSGSKPNKPKKPKPKPVVEYAHRLVLWAADGPPAPGEEALHLCHNAKCLNPMHLAWGPKAVNLSPSTEAYKELVLARRGELLWGVGVGTPLPPIPEGEEGELEELAKAPTKKAKAKAARARRLQQ